MASSLSFFSILLRVSLNPDNTIEEEIQSVSDTFDRTYVRNICGFAQALQAVPLL